MGSFKSFFNTGIDANNVIFSDMPWSRPGDYVLFQAQKILYAYRLPVLMILTQQMTGTLQIYTLEFIQKKINFLNLLVIEKMQEVILC